MIVSFVTMLIVVDYAETKQLAGKNNGCHYKLDYVFMGKLFKTSINYISKYNNKTFFHKHFMACIINVLRIFIA